MQEELASTRSQLASAEAASSALAATLASKDAEVTDVGSKMEQLTQQLLEAQAAGESRAAEVSVTAWVACAAKPHCACSGEGGGQCAAISSGYFGSVLVLVTVASLYAASCWYTITQSLISLETP